MRSVNDAKRIQRAEMRRIRSAIPDRSDRVGAIWSGVLERCRSRDARTVMAFVGVGSEPDTEALLDLLNREGLSVVLPRIEGGQIVVALHSADNLLIEGAYGIPSPAGPAIDPATIDVVIVPGLAFTLDGRRLGQGGGFYDRFLPLLRDDCAIIGVCFAEQIVDDLAVEPHDRKVQFVVTDAVQE
jgi:5-formyltetrahydrofolate cyclo-ligase